MRKKSKIVSMMLVLCLLMGVGAFASGEGPAFAGLANPWTDADLDQIEQNTGLALAVPDGVEYSARYREGMAQASWTWKDVDVTERMSFCAEAPAMDSETLTSLSGVYFTGLKTQSKELVVGGRCPGYMEFCRGDLGEGADPVLLMAYRRGKTCVRMHYPIENTAFLC